MDELDKFLGKWKLINEENAVEYAKALKMPNEQRRKMEEYLKNQPTKKPDQFEIYEKRGETVTVTSLSGAHKNSMSFTLGKEFKMPSPTGPLKTVIVLDGKQLRYQIVDDVNKLHGRREIVGNEAVMEMVANGVATRKRYVKAS